jgi:hypothetical protein
MKNNRMSKRFRKTRKAVLSFLLSVILFAWFNPSTSMAATVDARVFTCDAAELRELNLKVGQIIYDDDLCKGGVNVEPICNGDLYCVSIYQFYTINEKPKTTKAKNKAFDMQDAKGMRERAQSIGYWNCSYQLKSAGIKKVKSISTFEYTPAGAGEPKKIVIESMMKRISKSKYTVKYAMTIYGDAASDAFFITGLDMLIPEFANTGLSVDKQITSIRSR